MPKAIFKVQIPSSIGFSRRLDLKEMHEYFHNRLDPAPKQIGGLVRVCVYNDKGHLQAFFSVHYREEFDPKTTFEAYQDRAKRWVRKMIRIAGKEEQD